MVFLPEWISSQVEVGQGGYTASQESPEEGVRGGLRVGQVQYGDVIWLQSGQMRSWLSWMSIGSSPIKGNDIKTIRATKAQSWGNSSFGVLPR